MFPPLWIIRERFTEMLASLCAVFKSLAAFSRSSRSRSWPLFKLDSSLLLYPCTLATK